METWVIEQTNTKNRNTLFMTFRYSTDQQWVKVVKKTGENSQGNDWRGGLVIASCVWGQHAHHSAPAPYQTWNLNLTVFVSVFESVFVTLSVFVSVICIYNGICIWQNAHKTLQRLVSSKMWNLNFNQVGRFSSCGPIPFHLFTSESLQVTIYAQS